MPLPWRRQPPETAPPGLVLPELQEMQPIDPHAFVTEHEKALQASANNWEEIARLASTREEEYKPHIRQGLIDVWRANYRGAPLPAEPVLERATEKVASDLIVYTALTARHFSATMEGLSVKSSYKRTSDHFLRIPDHTMNYIIRSEDFPTTRFIFRQTTLANKMYAADRSSAKILGDLTHTYSEQPEQLAALAQQYEDDAAEFDDRYRELQAIISTDWHCPSPEQSILHHFCNSLKNRPEVFLPDFIKDIVEMEGDQKLLAIRDMARFALTAAGTEPITGDHLRRVLTSTYTKWSEFEHLDVLFRTRVDERIQNVAIHLGTIAGMRNFRSIRTYPSAEQVENLKNHSFALYTPDRTARRKAARRAKKTHAADVLPVSGDIAAQAERKQAEPRKIMVAKYVGQGYELSDTTLDDLIAHLKLGNNQRLIEDVKLMITWLQTNPISGASRPIRGNVGQVMHEGKSVTLRRLAPSQTAELPVHTNHRNWRVVYGLLKDAVVILDVLDHDTFDRKYKT